MSNNKPAPLATDNFHLDFPARMADGRQFTDYRPSCLLNLPEKNMTTFQYRQYLTHNANKIMGNYNDINKAITGCKVCSDYEIVPAYLAVECNKNTCTRSINDKSGVGMYFVNNN
jgi:hypothetical protein|tara:strand:+ start:287 stop:631 length:345 start_codon:yes stop_codon:yes gene_type:complete